MTASHNPIVFYKSPSRRTKLLGIFLLSSGLFSIPPQSLAASPAEISFTVKKFTVDGPSPINSQVIAGYFQTLQEKRYTLKTLQDVAKGLELIIRERGYPFYRVVLPPQTLNGGEIKLQILSFALDKIAVSNNHYFSKDNIIRSLPGLKTGQSPNIDDLSENLVVANKHPSKQLALTFKQSEAADKIDANIGVAEQRPFQATAILNTIGTPGTGGFRITAALQHSNLWGLDHVLNGSYTTSPDHADRVEQYGGSYSIPWYAMKGWFSAYYAHSNVNNGTVATDLNITGSGEMYGFHYQQLLPKLDKYEHWLDLGIDNRLFTNNIEFRNTQVNGNDVRSFPLSIQYSAQFPWQTARFAYNLQWVSNTGIGDHNNQADYSLVRTNAKQDWNALRYGANIAFNVDEWLVQSTYLGQYTEDTLIAGEQLGLGGTYNVRGYQERETSADKGDTIKFEVTTPSFQQVSLFAFYDYGHGHHISTFVGELKDWDLHSTGAGANWQWRQNVLAKITYANALSDAIYTQAGDSRIHASIIVRY